MNGRKGWMGSDCSPPLQIQELQGMKLNCRKSSPEQTRGGDSFKKWALDLWNSLSKHAVDAKSQCNFKDKWEN